MNLASLGATLRACRALRNRTLTDLADAMTAGQKNPAYATDPTQPQWLIEPYPVSASTLGAVENVTGAAPRIDLVWTFLAHLQIANDLRWAMITGVIVPGDAVLP